jgi:hypothetical protein
MDSGVGPATESAPAGSETDEKSISRAIVFHKEMLMPFSPVNDADPVHWPSSTVMPKCDVLDAASGSINAN